MSYAAREIQTEFGFTNVEIAEHLKITDRKIRRIMERVRALAEKEGMSPEGI